MKVTTETILSELNEVLKILPTDQAIIISLRYGDGGAELRKVIADARQRLESLTSKLTPQ